ncbi:MAG: ABC transporter permease [Anaerolineae bacterium]|nr:ABC transporter permease [Anaerolineae bacterium]
MATANQPIELGTDRSIFGEAREYKERGFWANAASHVWHDRLTMAAITVLVFLTFASFLGPPILERFMGLDPNATSITERFLPPGEGHWLGTDYLGRDQIIRLLYGGRISLGIAYTASIISVSIGVIIGIVAGYYGGILDDIIIWVVTTIGSVPTIFLLLIATTVWSPSPEVLVLILGFLGWLGISRLVRGEVLSVRERDYVIAAQAVGAKTWHLMFYHIFPNVISIVIILLALDAGSLILTESGLSFLGLGVQPPVPTWGNMLTKSQEYFANAPHLVIWPGLAITVTVLCFYLLGDGLRDALDPRSERHGGKREG